ncbi:MAG: 4-hydroxybutyryl-CoA dehydratase [Deltaproteobacteria bacterium]|uniref:4-hydroxyphenylacetate 3-hydroxylase family protein n=1 Tax=Desulfobacula sp. TaxID=2593537 RepID=UPI0019A16954|nr:4-hydroxybutyryl-CoA dehydratase [Candidatus Desulfobacula maris]MBL6994845.1 4-hydroxybutyryl-CoA dehydratase [Desulfobacula sp.]
MPLKTGKAYIESLKSLNLKTNIMGEQKDRLTGNSLISPSQKAVAFTFDAACSPDTQELFCAESSLFNDVVNRFSHLHLSTEDLINKVKMQRYCGVKTACCFQRCVGLDAANAIFSTTFECDKKHGTQYHERFKDYWKWIQKEDMVVDGAMTDPKGDRGKRPTDQVDPDLYLRIKERKPGGIVISGAKIHQTGMLNSHEILVMPTITMRKGEEAWAVCCAVPTDAKGIKYIYGRQASDTRKLEENAMDIGNPTFGGQEVMTIFDDVFVPSERIFMDGEIDFSGILVERFASYHRQSYGGCKAGVGDALIGATALIAKMNGVENASHIKDKIVEMIHLNETIYACGIACSATGEKTLSGNYLVNLLLANVCKLNVTRFPYELARLATDIAGGLLGTMPFAVDLEDPVTGPYIKKYLAANPDYNTVDRMKVFRLIENLVAGSGAVGYLIESMHGAGPPAAQRIMIGRQALLEDKIDQIKLLLDIQ